MLFSIAQRDHTRPSATFCVNHNYHLAVQSTEGD
jgi:hypothetical protein